MSPIYLNKPKRLIDEALQDPIKAICSVFEKVDQAYITSNIIKWAESALALERKPYDQPEGQMTLIMFYDSIKSLIKELNMIYLNQTINSGNLELLREKIDLQRITTLETIPEAVKIFCIKYSLEYTRSELRDWLVSGVLYCEVNPDAINYVDIIYTYEHLLVLTEAAYVLSQTLNDK
jgi:hypothetical protein